jgi:hypothetical protein
MTGPALPPESTWTTEWTAHRMPDAVRAAALANAVDLVKELAPKSTDENFPWGYYSDSVLDLARIFEAYLAGGQEADG